MRGTKPLTKEERHIIIEHLLKVGDARLLAMFVIGLNSGFRISEICSIRISDIYSIPHNRVMDDVYVRKMNTKGKIAGRRNEISKKAKIYVNNWISILKTERNGDFNAELPLFPSKGRGIVNGVVNPIQGKHAWRLFQKLFHDLDITFRGTHTMRKTIAHDIYQVERDVMAVKEKLGHVSLDSTASYLSTISSDSVKKIVEDMF